MTLPNLLRTFALFSAVLLSACSGGAVVFEPTPLPPDLSPVRYEHPSGAFSVLVPPDWSVFVQDNADVAHVSFAPPDRSAPLVFISALNYGRELSAPELGDLMQQYQTSFRPDLVSYTESERSSYGDGSWRVSGIRQTVAGSTQALNTFIERNGSLLGVVEVVLAQDAAIRTQAQSIVNTYALNDEASLPPAELSALTSVAPAQLEVVDVTTWTTPTGVFYVTGEVANHGMRALTDVPVRVTLVSADGLVVADAADTLMGYVLQPGSFAPFSIRFGQGQPAAADDFEVTVGGTDWEPQAAYEVVSADGLDWTDGTQFSPDGALFITGTITNTGDEAVRNPRVVATLFNGDGDVIAAAFTEADAAVLQPGSETAYTLLISDRGGAPEQYIVDVQAIPCGGRC